MCGIAGLIGSDDVRLMNRMLKTIQHRGPDDTGLKRFDAVGLLGPVVLGFQRLSIIDLSAKGHQPMCNEDGSVWVVFNGEIYNFSAIRDELLSLGHEFRSATDTEVVVHGYEEWGVDCVRRFNGMFALAVLDRGKEVVTLMRDRVGIKPLYYAQSQGRFLFASEAKALLEDPSIERAIDLESLDEYLSLGYVPGARTMFRDIRRLPPGAMLRYDGRTTTVTDYWSIPPHLDGPFEQADLVEEFHDLLVDAVRLQLISDVPLGAFLSGGLDSSAVVAIMARELGVERVKTFCVGYEDSTSRHDERPQAASLASWLGTEHRETVCTLQDAVDGLPNLVWQLDEPIAEDVLPAYSRLCRAAREHVTVVLTGEGSDEFGYGYRFYGLERIRQRWNHLPAGLRAGLRGVMKSFSSTNGLKRRALEYCLQDDEADAFLAWSSLVRPEQRQELYGDAVPDAIRRRDVNGWMHGLAEHRSERGVDMIAWLEARHRLVDYLLLRADRLSMATGLEARVPFLDHRIVEFMSRVPARAKIDGFSGKALLRKAVAPLLPPETSSRRKKPFGAPIDRWVGAAASTYLKDSRLVADGVVSRGGLAAILASRERDPRRYYDQGWALVMLEVWYRLYIRRDLLPTGERDAVAIGAEHVT